MPVTYALHFPIKMDRGFGQLHAERDWNRYVAQLVRQVLLTAKGQRVNRPDFGAGLRDMLFAPINDTSITLLRAAVLEALDSWLGSVLTVEQIEVEQQHTTLHIKLVYRVKGDGRKQTTVVEVNIA